MSRKAILVSFALILFLGVSIFAEQGAEEKPRDINQQLKEATCLRNWGMIITLTGVGTGAVLGGVLFFAVLSLFSGDWASEDNLDYVPYLAVYTGLSVIIGPILWISGGRRIRNIRESAITLQIRGPELARGNKLGGISLVWSY